MRSINILSAVKLKAYYMRRDFSRFNRECDADDKFSIREFWRQCDTKMMIVIRFLLHVF
jgi:hypothetical protein